MLGSDTCPTPYFVPCDDSHERNLQELAGHLASHTYPTCAPQMCTQLHMQPTPRFLRQKYNRILRFTAQLDIPARILEVKEHAWLITDNPGIVSRRDNANIARPEISRSAVVHHGVKLPGNNVCKMCSLATRRPGDRLDMLRPLPARFARHSDDAHISEMDTFHSCSGRRAKFIWGIDALLLQC
jgi:hypothetical protein